MVSLCASQDRVKLGSNSLYLYIGPPELRHPDDNPDQYDYNFFQTELADNIGFINTSFLSGSKASLHDEELDLATSAVFQDFISLLPRVHEANAMSDDMDKVYYCTLYVRG